VIYTGVFVPGKGISWRAWANHIPNKGGRHSGMLVLHEGMVAACKDVLLSNADNHMTRQRRMHVPENGMLSLSKEVFPFKQERLLGPCK